MAHYLATRMIKLKSQNLGGIQKHNQREFENHSNKDIDQNRSHLNYDLVNRENIDYRERITQTIEDQKTSDRKIRKDAVLTNEFFVTSSKEFFDDLDTYQQHRFFRTATNWFKERYGEQNVAYATVHNDETTPHMHIGVVPMKDGKLQGKNVFNRAELLYIQEKLPKYLEGKGFDIKRGEDRSKNYHVQPEDWKQQQEVARKETLELLKEKAAIAYEVSFLTSKANELEKEVEDLEDDKESLEAKKRAIKDGLSVESKKFQPYYAYTPQKDGSFKRNEEKTTISKADFRELTNVYRNAQKIVENNNKLELENDTLRHRVSFLEKTQKQLKSTLKTARTRFSEMFEKAGIAEDGESFFNRAMTFAHQFHSRKQKDVSVDFEIKSGQKGMFDDPIGEREFEENKAAEERKAVEEMQQRQIHYRGRDDFEM